MTMMKYLARTSSEGELNKVLHQNALYEGSIAERRRREGKLRVEQERLEGQMTSQMHAFASTLQAGAHAKALAQARAAAKVRQMNVAAEQAARVMGAVAPHRAAARDAALAVVAPHEHSWAPARPRSPEMLATQHHNQQQRELGAHYSVLLAEHSACLAVRPGRYCLRSVAGGSSFDLGGGDEELEPAYFTYALSSHGAATCCTANADAASATPWTVRQPSGHRSCTFATTSGAKLYAGAQGMLVIGEPPRPDMAQFVVIPQYDRQQQQGGGAKATAAGRDMQLPSPRPFSSAPVRSGGAVQPSPRPQTAAPVSVGATAGGADADSDAPLLVRLFHPPSRRFLHVSSTGDASLTPAAEAAAVPASGSTQDALRTVLPSSSQPGLVFELLQQRGSLPQRLSPQQKSRQLPSRSGSRSSASGQPTQKATLPVRGFDMGTGTVRGTDSDDDPFGALLWGEADGAPCRPLPQDAARFGGASSHQLPPPPYPLGLQGGVYREASRGSRRPHAPVDETRRTAWDASQLDLSDMMASGPLKLGTLFAPTSSCAVSSAPAGGGGRASAWRGGAEGKAPYSATAGPAQHRSTASRPMTTMAEMRVGSSRLGGSALSPRPGSSHPTASGSNAGLPAHAARSPPRPRNRFALRHE